MKSGQLPEPVFAFYLGNQHPGELVFGGVDPKHYTGSFSFVPLSSESYWEPWQAFGVLNFIGISKYALAHLSGAPDGCNMERKYDT